MNIIDSIKLAKRGFKPADIKQLGESGISPDDIIAMSEVGYTVDDVTELIKAAEQDTVKSTLEEPAAPEPDDRKEPEKTEDKADNSNKEVEDLKKQVKELQLLNARKDLGTETKVSYDDLVKEALKNLY